MSSNIWIPVKVPDQIRKCVAFLACAKADRTPYFCGSALFFGDPEDPSATYLLTAKHVIDGIKSLGVTETWVRVNKSSGRAEWQPISFERWIMPDAGSTTLDLAFAQVGLPDDADHLFFPRSLVLTPSLVTEMDIGVGVEVMITGLFVHHVGGARNVPIVRIGNLAAYPSEPVQTREFGTMNAFLIEARSIGGLSGSPVFIHPGMVRRFKGQTQFASGPIFYLAGLIHGHYDQKVGQLFSGNRIESVNSGIALVTPIEDILKFIDSRRARPNS